MSTSQIQAIFIAAIPLSIGLYFLLLGLRKVGKRPGVDQDFDARMKKFGNTFRGMGLLLLLFGLMLLARAFLDVQ